MQPQHCTVEISDTEETEDDSDVVFHPSPIRIVTKAKFIPQGRRLGGNVGGLARDPPRKRKLVRIDDSATESSFSYSSETTDDDSTDSNTPALRTR